MEKKLFWVTDSIFLSETFKVSLIRLLVTGVYFFYFNSLMKNFEHGQKCYFFLKHGQYSMQFRVRLNEEKNWNAKDNYLAEKTRKKSMLSHINVLSKHTSPILAFVLITGLGVIDFRCLKWKSKSSVCVSGTTLYVKTEDSISSKRCSLANRTDSSKSFIFWTKQFQASSKITTLRTFHILLYCHGGRKLYTFI